MKKNILRAGPVVCAVDQEYQIMVPVNCETLMSVCVNGVEYYCHSNGVRRSRCPVQKFIVPMEELDAAKEYTIRYRRVISRQAYACLKGPLIQKTISFHPLGDKNSYNVYVLSDTHGIKNEAIAAASYFGEELDLLILNGDISSSCMTQDEAMLPYDIAYGVTGGSIPCIITRGNHDLRGRYSEDLHDWMPAHNGCAYYQACLDPFWLLILDCGEDKVDGHREYGGTAAFHVMRKEETAFLKHTVQDTRKTFLTSEVKHKIIISHIPVPYRDHGSSKGEAPFDIENDIYAEWTDIINRDIAPELYIAGHLHRNELWPCDSPNNERGVNCPVLIAGKPVHNGQRNCIGAALTFSEKKISVFFTDKNKSVVGSETIQKRG